MYPQNKTPEPDELPEIYEFVILRDGFNNARYAMVTGVFRDGTINIRLGPSDTTTFTYGSHEYKRLNKRGEPR